jgi:hypothetical protein
VPLLFLDPKADRDPAYKDLVPGDNPIITQGRSISGPCIALHRSVAACLPLRDPGEGSQHLRMASFVNGNSTTA